MDFYPAPHCPALAYQTRSQAWIFMILYDNSPLFHVKTYVNSKICTFEPTWNSLTSLPHTLNILRARLTTVAQLKRKYCAAEGSFNTPNQSSVWHRLCNLFLCFAGHMAAILEGHSGYSCDSLRCYWFEQDSQVANGVSRGSCCFAHR